MSFLASLFRSDPPSRLRKSYGEPDQEEALKSLALLVNEPNFRNFIELREAQREEVIRQLQTQECISDPNRHFMVAGKLEAIDEELDMFANLTA